MNRPVRTRMPWWCGEGELKAPLYPIGQIHLSISRYVSLILPFFITTASITMNLFLLSQVCRQYNP